MDTQPGNKIATRRENAEDQGRDGLRVQKKLEKEEERNEKMTEDRKSWKNRAGPHPTALHLFQNI